MARSREEIQQEYDEFYKANPNKWGGTDRSSFMIEQLRPIIPGPLTVLDFGCGQGIALENYQKSNPFAELYGIDISEEAIRLAKERVPDAHFTTENEFEDIKTFGLVFCLGVAEHMEDLKSFLRELRGRLDRDGICYIEVPHNLVYSKGPETFRRMTVGSKQVEWHLSRTKWEILLFDAGFNVIKRLKGPKPSWEYIWILE